MLVVYIIFSELPRNFPKLMRMAYLARHAGGARQ